ncbi:MAG TPA: DUF3237 domain-containing protein [Steroidobacteraceae bacterium]|nr:DUF3237 domain-containing protein [Steroidobacteraceae bacterium]
MQPELALLFEASATLGPALTVGPTPAGIRRVVPITGGTFEGPQLRGTILAGGADWQYVRADGVLVVEAQYLLRTTDEVLIQVHNSGLRHGPAEVLERIAQGEDVDPREYYFRAIPTLIAPAGRYEWLNRRVFICSAARFVRAVRLWVYQLL